MTSQFTLFASLTDEELIDRVTALVRQQRRATAHLVAALAELDRRKLYLPQGCPSLCAYCTRVLHLAEHAAYNRIEAARAASRFPVILDRLHDGSLTLAAIRLLAPVLTSENHLRLLELARHKSKREVDLLVAAENPQPDAVLAHVEKRKLATTERPRQARVAPPGSRHIPAAVKREVWKRDGGRCAFLGTTGRCAEEAFLEFHHVVPFAEGGPATTRNIELRCRAHNAHEANLAVGRMFVEDR